VVIDGGTYHVLTRGNNGQPVFHLAADFEKYLRLLTETLREHRLTLFHFALMPNHVHLVLRTTEAVGLSRAMLSLNLSYSLYYRRRHRYAGHVWQGRYKSLLIERDDYLLACGRYVELNPIRASLASRPEEYLWTSYRAYAAGANLPYVAVGEHPLYATFGSSPHEQQERYRQFILDGLRQPDSPYAPWHHVPKRRRAVVPVASSRGSFPIWPRGEVSP
jgi:putative transposase